MRIIDVIEWADDPGTEIVHRIPQFGSGDFRLGSQLIVRESQQAVFMRDGRSLDVFGPGRYTLETANIPLLASLINLATSGNTPFTAEAYFVSSRTFMDMKWGTPQPVIFRDPELKMVRLRAFGTFSIRVGDPRVFVGDICGAQGAYEREALNGWMREFILTRLIDTLGELKKSILDLPMYYDELSIAVKNRVLGDFGKYGVEVIDFTVGAITPPEEVQKMIDQRTSMSVIGDMGEFTQFQAAQALRDAAQQPGGMAGAGMGLGAGISLGQVMGQAMAAGQQAPAAPAQPAAPVAAAAAAGQIVCTACNHANPEGAKFCMGCGAKIEAPPAGTFCPQCGVKNAAGARFCTDCGTALAAPQ